MSVLQSPAAFWTLAVIQVLGLASAWFARLSEGSAVRTTCQWLFFCCLTLVGRRHHHGVATWPRLMAYVWEHTLADGSRRHLRFQPQRPGQCVGRLLRPFCGVQTAFTLCPTPACGRWEFLLVGVAVVLPPPRRQYNCRPNSLKELL